MTIRTELAKYDTRENFFFEWKWVADGKKQIDMAHITLYQLQHFYPEVMASIAGYFKFGFVRDPYTRFLSAVAQHLKLGTAHTRQAIFREPDLFYRVATNFALSVLDQKVIDADFKLVHFRQQSNFYYLNSERWVDRVFKLEEPESILHTRAETWLGDAMETPKNRTPHFTEGGYDLKALAPAARNAIGTFYERDFERFGYARL